MSALGSTIALFLHFIQNKFQIISMRTVSAYPKYLMRPYLPVLPPSVELLYVPKILISVLFSNKPLFNTYPTMHCDDDICQVSKPVVYTTFLFPFSIQKDQSKSIVALHLHQPRFEALWLLGIFFLNIYFLYSFTPTKS